MTKSWRFNRGSLLATLLLVATAGAAQADASGDSVFCAWVQQEVAGTELLPAVVTHTSFEAFVKSKAQASPFMVQQFWSNPLPGHPELPRVVSCKMKTAERINQQAQLTRPVGSAPLARGDQSCDFIQRKVLMTLLNQIPRGELAIPAGTLRVDPEEMTRIGPLWLKPWPFEPLSRDKAGLLHIRSRALFVPFAWWIPMPDRFKGTHYCHLVAPDFLNAVLRGTVPAGV